MSRNFSNYNNVNSVKEIFANKQALWDQAYTHLISTGSNAVKIPLDFGNLYWVSNEAKGELMPYSSLNYLMMYKDSLQKIHAEWINLMPDSVWLYGQRDSYTGRILIKSWDNKLL